MDLVEVNSVDETDPIWAKLKRLAQKSMLKSKHSCVLTTKKGEIVSWGVNQNRTHPKYGSKPPYFTLHAEGAALFDCIKKGCNPKGLIAYVYRKGGTNSKPCKCCQALLARFGIKIIYHS